VPAGAPPHALIAAIRSGSYDPGSHPFAVVAFSYSEIHMNHDVSGGVQLRLTVQASAACPEWQSRFARAGWTPLASSTNKLGLLTWLLKRGSMVFAFVQSAAEPLPQVVTLPSPAAGELSALLVTTGLARPA